MVVGGADGFVGSAVGDGELAAVEKTIMSRACMHYTYSSYTLYMHHALYFELYMHAGIFIHALCMYICDNQCMEMIQIHVYNRISTPKMTPHA